MIAAIADAPCAAIWLKLENFGDDATGEKMAAYIEACQDFHARGLPLVGDMSADCRGLAHLAFGAVGGIAHGVTMQQNFQASGWRRPRVRGSGGPSWRVYIPQLDFCSNRRRRGSFLRLPQRSGQCAAAGIRIVARTARATCSTIPPGMQCTSERGKSSA